ncbi:hypothetical protein LJ737_15190 [Hymenobacter sp. 15J16-1T3B]|uniref:hypothetical protein n=1 Tax=Hymenobacter sp. 15J16-1T3B TaxID=2886941 RepID=UPI001D1089F7|nr:hypothetical protein [Hymenobacter sp. 15J16-1T3B]MCC3158593.1 hypothetical protein [Hymenobacter sp. 15J16-1T3B]
MKLKATLLLLLTLVPMLLSAQSYEKEYEVYFAWEVKQVDEFIERFNNEESAFINEYLKKKYPSSSLSREKMIKSLFNTKSSNWNFGDINSFIKQVSSVDNPQYLDFNSGNWFARVNCRISYCGKPYSAMLIMQRKAYADGSAKWVIVDVKYADSNMRQTMAVAAQNGIMECPQPVDSLTSLNPMSHAIGFMNLDLATQKPENIGNFVIASAGRSRNLNLFIDACLRNKLKIIQATSTTYSFLQIKGWRIEIKQFNRQSQNSGWLISKLVKIPS